MKIEGVYKDHLGNVRLTYSDSNGDGAINPSSEIISEKNYYLFGLEHQGYNNVVSGNSNSVAENFGYNGKENNPELGIEWMDFGARNYDASLGRWMNIDPLAEMMRRHSPYNFAFDNPVYFIDPDGMMPFGSCCGNPFAGIGARIASSVESAINNVSNSISSGFNSIVSSVSNALSPGDRQKVSGESLTIYGNGTGEGSTRDIGTSSGSVDMNDMPSAPGGYKGGKSPKDGDGLVTTVKKVAETFRGGFKDTKKVSGFVETGNDIADNAGSIEGGNKDGNIDAPSSEPQESGGTATVTGYITLDDGTAHAMFNDKNLSPSEAKSDSIFLKDIKTINEKKIDSVTIDY